MSNPTEKMSFKIENSTIQNFNMSGGAEMNITAGDQVISRDDGARRSEEVGVTQQYPQAQSQLQDNERRPKDLGRSPSQNDERTVQPVASPDILVKEVAEFFGEPADFIYDMTTDGCVVIINNVQFDHLKAREGSDVDVERLRHFFCEKVLWGEGFEYNKRHAKDLTVDQMKDYITQQSRRDFSKYGAFFLIILSHGNKYGICGTDSEHKDSENILNVENDVLPLFTCSKVPSLAEKPKVFIIQACRGDMDDNGFPIETDAEMVERPTRYRRMIPDFSEYLVCYPCVPGYTSLRNSRDGSYFIQALINVFEAKYETEDLARMMIRVNYMVSRATNSLRIKQLPSHDVRISRLTYFHSFFLKMKKYMIEKNIC